MFDVYPVLVVPARRGGIPCLTPEQARDILEREERLLSLSVFDASEYLSVCSSMGKGFAEFCGLGEFNVILTVRSPYVGSHASASASEASVFGTHEKGRMSFNSDQWAKVVRAIQPAIAVTLYDHTSLCESSSKRRKAAVMRSLRWANLAMSSSDLGCTLMKPSSVIDEKTSLVYVEELCQNECTEQYLYRLGEIAKKHHVMSPALSLGDILMSLKAGVRYIECALPWMLAEKGVALVFDMNPVSGSTPERYQSQIDLNDYCFAVDIRPLSHFCECYTCRRHTRAYLHHLLTVQEMNSGILLVIHNLTFLVRLIRLYRKSSSEHREFLLHWILSQL